ncbi:hypothetical protein DFH09DRAFT_1452318 [Mycena vulgaris]|nr:hypothetical protein DFH09DRAFT_1452318 [Mycena vulgaris]
MPNYDPRDIPVEYFYSETAKDPLPTSFSGAVGASYNRYPQNGYHFPAAAQPSYPSPPPPNYYHRVQHAAHDPTYSPSRFVQPSLHSPSYGFPAAPQSTASPHGAPTPFARRNSAVEHPPRTRPPVSDYSSLSGALDAPVGPTRVRSNSIRLISPYKTGTRPRGHSIVATPEPERARSSRPRRGSKRIGPCLPDGPADHIRVPQEAYEEPVTELGYQRVDHHRLQPIAFSQRHATVPGVRLADIDGETCPGLAGPGDRVFEGVFPYREVKIRVLWPGYPSFQKRFKTQDGRRSLLLMMVATAVTCSMDAITSQLVPVKRGYEPWVLGRRPNGTHGLRPEDILM